MTILGRQYATFPATPHAIAAVGSAPGPSTRVPALTLGQGGVWGPW